jgi:outer membrane protein
MKPPASPALLLAGLLLAAPHAFPQNKENGPRLDARNPTRVPIPLEFLDLKTCYELALLRMETIGLSEEDIRVAQARYWQAVGAILPNIKVVGEQALYKNRAAAFSSNSGSFGGGGDATGTGGSGASEPEIDNYPRTARVNVRMPLFGGLRDFETAKAAKAEVEGKRQTRSRTLQNLYLDVATSFYEQLGYEDDLRILEEITRTLNDRVNELDRRVKLGKSRDSELLQSQTSLGQAKVTLERTRGLLGASREMLAFYTGLRAEELKLKDTTPPPPDSLTVAEYLAKTADRPDILAAVQTQRSARAKLSAAKGEHWPSVNFEGDYYLYDSDKIQDGEWSGFVTVELPIFEGGSIEARVNENKALFAQSRLDLAKLQREAERDVRTSFNNFNSSLAEFARLEEAAATAELNYKAQQGDYNLGVINNLDVLQSLRELQDLRRDLADTRYTVKLNLIKLHVNAGDVRVAP